MVNTNPKNPEELEREKTVHAKREDPAKSQETDKFTEQEQKDILRIVLDDAEVGINSYADWKTQKEKDLQQIHAEKPSIIEGLTKKKWMSDRNLGICPGILDIYQATLLSTCFNPDSIHFKDTELNDINNKDNLEKFTKWAIGKHEIDFQPEVDDFINNRVALGFSMFKIDWEIKYEWVDSRIPVFSKTGRRNRLIKYDVETSYKRFERARIRNIDNVDDILMPAYGKKIQELPFIIEILHINLSDIPDLEKRKIILDKFGRKDTGQQSVGTDTPSKLKMAPQIAANRDNLGNQKAQALGITQTVDPEGRDFPLDVYEWYGYLTRGKKREKYRIWIEPTTETFIAGKPLRQIRRDGKFPYAGGALRRIPGQVRGGSLTGLIANLVNALNNNYNQTSDYQTVQNMPFGFANFDEGFTQSVYEIEPGKIYSCDGNPAESVYFPNLQRSLVWSYQDKNFILEMIERLTGAASYFLTSQAKDTTATRDTIVENKGETKFGLWVGRIQNDIVEALNMAIYLYQDWAPPGLGKRVLGEDGKQIIRNMSIDTIRGNYNAYMVPDVTSGSKSYEKQIMLWAARELAAGCIWLSPQMNPRGNWLLWKEVMLKQGIENPEHYLTPQPKQVMDDDEEAKQEFTRMMQGEAFDPPEGATPAVVRHFATHMKQKDTEYQELDKEYREIFDNHLFKTFVNYQQFMANLEKERMAMQVAGKAVQNLQSLGMQPQAIPGEEPIAQPAMAPAGGMPQ